MKIRQRRVILGAAVLGIIGLAAGIVFFVGRSQPAGPVPDSADVQVCSHVDLGDHVFAPGGDWNTPAVAGIAYRATPYVRDAYTAAAEAHFPFQATPDQAQAVIRTWNHLIEVCTVVMRSQNTTAP
jgi:hypothetical protein